MSYGCDLEAVTHQHGTGFVVTGWLATHGSPRDFSVALVAGGRVLDGTLRFAPRPDLPAGLDLRSLGFEMAIGRADAALLLQHPVILAVGGPDGVASAEKRLVPPRWAWEIETAGERAVSGWAVDLLRPEVPPVLLLRTGAGVAVIPAGAEREDVVLAPGVHGRAFMIELPADTDGWGELCLGDPLHPIASLRLPRGGRRPALALLTAERARGHREALAAIASVQPKFTDFDLGTAGPDGGPGADPAAGFEPAGRAPRLRAGGLTALGGRIARRAVVWQDASRGTALVADARTRLSPGLAAAAARFDGRGAGWSIVNGLHDLPAAPGAACPAMAFPFLRPRPTLRLLAQLPHCAPVLLAPAAALDGWSPTEQDPAALAALLLRRLGPPDLLHDVLYALPGAAAQADAAPSQAAPSLPAATRPAPDPLVSLIVPSRDNIAHLAKLVASAAALRRRYPTLELVLVDNDSRSPAASAFLDWAASDWLRVVRDRGGFNFSRLSNLGARAARGAVLLFCNDDVEIGPDFDLAAFVGHLSEPDVGIAGHTLLFEDGTIQHAGVVVGAYDAADNGQTAFSIEEGGYFGLARITREVSAVTGAFMAVRRDVFEALGGFDERDFAISFNDVDLCLRAGRAGHTILNAWCGTVRHHESVSRGRLPDRLAVELAEVRKLRRIWDTANFQDPYYSPGFDRHALPYTRPLWHRLGLAPAPRA